MSLILEALRKSEAERRRGQAPDVALELSPLPAPKPRGNGWLWPAVIVLALVVAVAAWWWQRQPPAQDVAAQAAPAITPQQAAAPTAPAIVARPVTSEPTAPATTPIPAPPARPTTVPVPAFDSPTALDAPPPPFPAPQPVAPAPPPASGMSGIKLSMHLWNDVPTRRFVVLNGQRMAEGERVGDLLLVEILRDGVVVERDGQRARINLP